MSGGFWLITVTAATLAPLCALARFRRIYPHRPMLYLLLVPIALAAGLILLPESRLQNGLWVLGAVEAGLVLLLLGDLLTLPWQKTFSAERTTQRVASLVKPHRVALTVSNHSDRAWIVW